MQILDSIVQIILENSGWWWLAIPAAFVLYLVSICAAIYIASKSAIEEPEDREEAEWMRSRVRRDESQLKPEKE